MVRGVRTADEADDGDRPEEYVRMGWTPTSQWTLTARLDPERGALVDRAIHELARAEGITVADAVVRMADIALAAIRDGDSTKRELRGDELAAVVVHVDATTYPQARSAERGAAGRIANGPGLPRQVIERLACAGRVRTIVHDGDGSPLDVGRSHRLATRKQFRALLARDRGCVYPGCESRRGLHAHHVWHWLDGGPTNMANLVLLCSGHHHAVHDEAFRIEPDGPGHWRFLRMDGRALLTTVQPADFPDCSTSIDEDHATEPTAPTTRWDGSHLDRHYAVSVLAERRRRPGHETRRGGADGSR